MEKKVCSKCGIEKELSVEHFNKDKTKKDGFRGACKECDKKYRENNKVKIVENKKQYRKDNKEKMLEYAKQYSQDNKEKIAKRMKQYSEDNKEKISEKKKQYREDNKERFAERAKLYYEDNKEKIAKYYEDNKEHISERKIQYYEDNKERFARSMKQHAKDNSESYRIRNQNRRALKLKLPHTLTIQQWETAKLHFNNKCAYCGKELPLEQEHFLALTKGGEYTINNIIPACKSCNDSKLARDFFIWYPKHKHYSKKREKIILKFLGYKGQIQQLSII